MPKCIKCETVQSKLNKGKLCKKCNNNSEANTQHNESTDYTPLEDRNLIDMIKETMVKEARLNNEIIIVLKDQIEFLKDEIKHKNLIIKNLINISTKYSQPIDTSGNNSIDKRDDLSVISESTKVNDSVVDNNNCIIVSADESLSVTDDYTMIEKDDVCHSNPNNWINNDTNRDLSPNKQRMHISKKHEINFEHTNRFNGLADESNTQNNNQLNALYDIADKTIHEVRPSDSINHLLQSKNICRPEVVTQHYPENNFTRKPIRPGQQAYNEAVRCGKPTVIFSTSITKGINLREFNKVYNTGNARFTRFHGAKAKYMQHYVLPTLIEENPQVVVVQCSGNDLPTSKANPTPVIDIANTIIKTAKTCEYYGANQVLICGVITRKRGYMERRRIELNNLLKDMCYDSDLYI